MIEKDYARETSMRRWLLALAAVALGLLAPAAATAAGESVVLSVGHTDAVAPTYEGGELALRVKDDTAGGAPVFRDPADVVFHAKAPESELEVPSPAFSFLGEVGDRVWMLPQVQDPDLLWPGFSSEAISSGVLEGDALEWRLTGVEGPGEVFLFQVGAFGNPEIAFRSDEPLPQSTPVGVGIHAHYNWAFTADGIYTLTFEVTATADGGGELTTGEVDYTFVVGGFGDLGVELAIAGVRDRYAPGETVTLEAAQSPGTVLEHYHWFVKCPGDGDFAVVDGAHGPVHSFAAELDGDGCRYRVTVYDEDHEAIATSEPVAVAVEVPFFGGRTVLSAGHVDAVAPRYEDGELAIAVKDGSGDEVVVRDPSEVVLHAKTPESEQTVPDVPEFAFLGSPGASVWILPQLQDPALLWAGFSSEQIPLGAFVDDELTWTLTGIDGPGQAFLYVEDFLGLPTHRFRSDEPLPQPVAMRTDTHDHFNWAFTAHGRYTLTFEVSGTPVGGSVLTSGEVSYDVLVGSYADLGVRLAVTGAEPEYEPGDSVTLTAAQDPRTDLDHYHWFRRCGQGDDYATVAGALEATHTFTVDAGDDGCEYKAAVYDHDHTEVAASGAVVVHVHASEPEPEPEPQAPPSTTPGPPSKPRLRPAPAPAPKGESSPRRPALGIAGVRLRGPRGRVLSVRLRCRAKRRARVRVTRGGRLIALGKVRRVRKGGSVLRLRLPGKLAPGRYRVRVRYRVLVGRRGSVLVRRRGLRPRTTTRTRSVVLRVPRG